MAARGQPVPAFAAAPATSRSSDTASKVSRIVHRPAIAALARFAEIRWRTERLALHEVLGATEDRANPLPIVVEMLGDEGESARRAGSAGLGIAPGDNEDRRPRSPFQKAAFTPNMKTFDRAEASLMVRSGIMLPSASLTLPPLMKFSGAKPFTRMYSAKSFTLG